ncbi:hypothetical protein EVG20_g8974 [Dentipellis fragilis]|uniref:Uncharacterized protein n=1 Tax=Dentipellis fragilis TaxID=205917 RepID=A0A4Y9Y411_9AGAM|nr:hypothetical protein EVG20_g8974 [Dentipellis fragilis]
MRLHAAGLFLALAACIVPTISVPVPLNGNGIQSRNFRLQGGDPFHRRRYDDLRPMLAARQSDTLGTSPDVLGEGDSGVLGSQPDSDLDDDTFPGLTVADE